MRGAIGSGTYTDAKSNGVSPATDGPGFRHQWPATDVRQGAAIDTMPSMNPRHTISVLARTAAEHGWPTTLRLAFLMIVDHLLRGLIIGSALVWWWTYH